MMSNAAAAPRMWAWEWRGWRLSLLRQPPAKPGRVERALAIHRRAQDAAAARSELQRQWGSLLLDRPLLNG